MKPILKGVSSCHYTGTVRQNICDLVYIITHDKPSAEVDGWKDDLNKNLVMLDDILRAVDSVNCLN